MSCESFVFHDGTRAATYIELLDKLKTLTQDQYDLYTSQGTNGFITWLDHRYPGHYVPEFLQHSSYIQDFIVNFATMSVRIAQGLTTNAEKQHVRFFKLIGELKETIDMGINLRQMGTKQGATEVNNSILESLSNITEEIDNHEAWLDGTRLLYDRLHLVKFLLTRKGLLQENILKEPIEKYLTDTIDFETELYERSISKKNYVIDKSKRFVVDMENHHEPWHQVIGARYAELYGSIVQLSHVKNDLEQFFAVVRPQIRLIESLIAHDISTFDFSQVYYGD